jgi:hypothetical protein
MLIELLPFILEKIQNKQIHFLQFSHTLDAINHSKAIGLIQHEN